MLGSLTHSRTCRTQFPPHHIIPPGEPSNPQGASGHELHALIQDEFQTQLSRRASEEPAGLEENDTLHGRTVNGIRNPKFTGTDARRALFVAPAASAFLQISDSSRRISHRDRRGNDSLITVTPWQKFRQRLRRRRGFPTAKALWPQVHARIRIFVLIIACA